MAAGSRRRSRIIAFQALYEADQAEHPLPEVLARHLDEAELGPRRPPHSSSSSCSASTRAARRSTR